MESGILNRDYKFPFEPYDIQIQLMNKIYESIDESKIALIESPTGTGKSLSIICSVMRWMTDHKARQVEHLNSQIEKLSLANTGKEECLAGDWISTQLQQISNKKEIYQYSKNLEKINQHISYSKELKKKLKLRKYFGTSDNNATASFSGKRSASQIDDSFDDLNEENELIIKYLEETDSFNEVDLNDKSCDANQYSPKIFYCSRTHSQLSQFINEIKKTKWSIENENSLMLVPLSSRVNYCVNPSVNQSGNANIINEKCNELQGSKQKCNMYKHSSLQQLNENILADVQDIEDIASKGKHLKACPYYASRLSLPEAEIIVLPYNILFHKGTRESFGIHLNDSIVIVDEAHNLLETLANVYSVQVRWKQLKIVLDLVTKYMTKYYTRFNSVNLMYLKQLIFILKKLLTFLGKPTDQTSLIPLDFVLKLEFEHINIYKLIEFIDKSYIASKLHMFALKACDIDKNDKKTKIFATKAFLSQFKKSANVNSISNSTSESNKTTESLNEQFNSNMVYSLKEFLLSLKDYSVDGKVLLDFNVNEPEESTCKYILLNPSNHFKDILSDCRSVVLCGGTMQPFDDYIDQLIKPLGIPKSRVLTFSCDHVIAKSNLVAIGCANGPNNVELNYTFASRKSVNVVNETGQAVLQFCQIIPKGVVVFFPSYEYEEFVFKQWQQFGILSKIEKCKRVFKEPKKSSLTATVLSSYTKFIKSNSTNGAILFSVIGGKMSEGINFSDDLGRGIIVIGLPYANRNSPELQEKMSYLERLSPNLANEYYENLCMRAVNQSIGRAIRHKDDYAAIILLDNRYCSKKSVQTKLSDWIKSRYIACDQFAQVLSQITSFFKNENLIQLKASK